MAYQRLIPPAANLFERAMQAIRSLDKAGARAMVRTSSGQMRNIAANAPTVIRDASGKVTKLAPGQPVPAGATVLNLSEAPVGKILGGGAAAFGVPVALGYQRTGERQYAEPSVPIGEGLIIDPASGISMGPSAPPQARPAPSEAAPVRPAASAPMDAEPRYSPWDETGTSYRPTPMENPPAPRPVAATAARTSSSPAVEAAQQAALSGMFRDPYAGMSSARLMELAAARPDDPAMFFRADEALRRERPEMFKGREEGMAHGGVAAGGKPAGHHKDAVIMKALEIIHHMIRGR